MDILNIHFMWMKNITTWLWDKSYKMRKLFLEYSHKNWGRNRHLSLHWLDVDIHFLKNVYFFRRGPALLYQTCKLHRWHHSAIMYYEHIFSLKHITFTSRNEWPEIKVWSPKSRPRPRSQLGINELTPEYTGVCQSQEVLRWETLNWKMVLYLPPSSSF